MTRSNNPANHIVLAFLGILIMSGLISSMISVNLVHTTSALTVGKQTATYRGFWRTCEIVGNGAAACHQIAPSASLNKLPTYLAFSRVCIIISFVAVTIATFLSILGNPLMTKCCNVNRKMMTFLTAGTFLLSGILSLVCYSWYTNAAMKNYVTVLGPGKAPVSKWDLGWGMWVGFVSSIFTILGSGHALYTAISTQNEEGVKNYEAGREMGGY